MSKYIFTDSQADRELQRLQLIEQIFDPLTHQHLETTGIQANWNCLEVGAGVGSIARWLAAKVDRGRVTAVDLDTRPLKDLQGLNLDVIEADIGQFQQADNSFDLIHVRFVLIHLVEFQAVLSKMWKWLKPGGWIVIEEPDFSAARAIASQPNLDQSFHRVNQAIQQMFDSRGMDSALGVKLPALLDRFNPQQLIVDNYTPLSRGGSPMAQMMKMSTMQLAPKYMATGLASEQDIDNYCTFATSDRSWGIYHGTVGVVAQKSFNT